ncbi:MAG: Mrp/NBP35 family ATP-binding protein [Chloroflexi bacterium]|nr:Mrp/NBP35 family ATP-binding protein [Chloroflexota bacterium]
MERKYADIEGDGGSDILGQVISQQERLAERMKEIGQVIAISSGKGGVGKSALTSNLAAALADEGFRVGALDADLNGPTLTKMLDARNQNLYLKPDGVEPAIGVLGVKVMSMDLFLESYDTALSWKHATGLAEDAFVWRGTIETSTIREFLADTIWGELDYLLVDLPPGANHLSTLARWIPGITGLAVTIPSGISQLVVKKSVRAVQESGGKLLGLVENMAGYVCPECSQISPLFNSKPKGQRMANSLGLPLLSSIPFDPRLALGCDEGKPLVLTHPNSPSVGEIKLLANKLRELS